MATVHETALYDAAVRGVYEQAFATHLGALIEHIESGQASGAIATDVESRDTAEWLICMIERAPMWIASDVEATSSSGTRRRPRNLIWETLYARAPIRAGDRRARD